MHSTYIQFSLVCSVMYAHLIIIRDYFHLNENTELTEKDHLVREVPKTYLKKTSNLMSLYNKLT